MHGFLLTIVNDRGSQIINALWKHLCQRYSIKIKFSSTHHLETDGQTKNANKVIKNYLHVYINHVQDDWVNHLLIAEFAANNHVNAFTGITSFFADNGFYPCMGVELSQIYQKAGRRAEFLVANKIVAN